METTHLRHAGFDVNVRVRSPWLDLNVLTEVICNDEYRLMELKDVIGDVRTILDVGGHIGSFGLFAKSLWPDAKLIVVEPDGENISLYRKNLKANGFEGTFFSGAVNYNPECRCLVHSPSTTGGYVLRTRQEAEQYIHDGYRFYNRITDDRVPLFTIEKIAKMCRVETFDLAKWDCEGGEVDAFQNMSHDAAAKFRYMVGEYHIWSETSRYLKADLLDTIRFWRAVKKKFPHLNFSYKENRLGLFQAWPNDREQK
jgi:FkbM family methyltransferase